MVLETYVGKAKSHLRYYRACSAQAIQDQALLSSMMNMAARCFTYIMILGIHGVDNAKIPQQYQLLSYRCWAAPASCSIIGWYYPLGDIDRYITLTPAPPHHVLIDMKHGTVRENDDPLPYKYHYSYSRALTSLNSSIDFLHAIKFYLL